jgi:hypothetical protein
MKRFRFLLLLLLIPTLPGCMVVGAAVSVGGYALGGPAQYAGTALSLAEYSYELAVNDKTPDTVLKDKVLEVVDILDGPDYVGAWETPLAATRPVQDNPATLDGLALAYNLQDLPEALRPAPALQGPALPAAKPLPQAPALLAEARPAPPQPAPAAAPAVRAPAVNAPVPAVAVDLPDWPSLAQVQPQVPASQAGWSVRLPVSGVVL